MTKDEAMKLALEVLKNTRECDAVSHAIQALEKALAKQEQGEQETNRLIQQRDHAYEIIDKLCDAVLGFDRPEWSSAYFFEDAVNEVEEKMFDLEKQEQGEPVAWIRGSGLEMLKLKNGGAATVYANEAMSNHSTPLYTTPPQRKPLTDEQIEKLFEQVTKTGWSFSPVGLARIIEAAHGIKE